MLILKIFGCIFVNNLYLIMLIYYVQFSSDSFITVRHVKKL